MRNGDFRIISVMGTSFEEEMGRRIRKSSPLSDPEADRFCGPEIG